jgi:hypothetical protein
VYKDSTRFGGIFAPVTVSAYFFFNASVSLPLTFDRPTFRSFILCIHTVSLQASVIIRQLGLVPTSNKVSSDINFENLIFGKRKPRIVRSRQQHKSFPSAPRNVADPDPGSGAFFSPGIWDGENPDMGSGIRNKHPG